MKLALALTLLPALAFGQTVYYLPETTLAAAQQRSNQLCLQVGCGTGSTVYLENYGKFFNGQGYLIIPQSGPYALPLTNQVGTAALSPGEIASELNAAQVSPSLAAQTPNQTIAVGQPWSFAIPAGTFVDPRGETMTYATTLANGNPLPAWLSFSPTGVFTGTPTAAGTINVTVTATDQSGFTASETLEIIAQ